MKIRIMLCGYPSSEVPALIDRIRAALQGIGVKTERDIEEWDVGKGQPHIKINISDGDVSSLEILKALNVQGVRKDLEITGTATNWFTPKDIEESWRFGAKD
jgi:hypothetical protein